MKRKILLCALAALLCVSFVPREKCDDTDSSLEQRLDSMLSQMTLQEKIEQLYYKTDGNDRLSIPQFTGSDGPHGVGNNAKGFSCFPVTIAMAASWDVGMVARVGRAIAMEQAARGRDRIAGPTLDLLIDPRIGRAPECVGEDPYLGGVISQAFVLGQNTTPVFGTIKHYNLNTYEKNRRTNNYRIDRRSLVEFWGEHWKRTVQRGGAMSVMCAYNWVNGDKCAENRVLIKDILRDHWGFNFYTMCDWGGFDSTVQAMNSELDFCEGNDLYIKELPGAVTSGRIDSALVENSTRNVLRTKLLSGMMDVGRQKIPMSIVNGVEHQRLVYESGLRSLVLLKNSADILPLNVTSVGSIAVIGPNAGVLPLDGKSSSQVVAPYVITVEKALKKAIGDNRVKYVKGCNINDMNRDEFGAALTAAKSADCVLFVAGIDNTIEGEDHFTGGDRLTGSVMLPGVQYELINALAKVNPNIILVVISGGPCSVNPVVENVKGLLYAFYPGQEGGRAIVDVVLGNYNPSGKLPATLPKNDAQIRPISMDFSTTITDGIGYRWFDNQNIEPDFAFGFGLSYTTFEYSNIKVEGANEGLRRPIVVSVDVKNSGKRAGEEVVQLYLATKKIVPHITMPQKQLKGFEKIMLEPNQTKRVSFEITAEELYIYNHAQNRYQVPTGEFVAMVGGSSDNLPLKADFTLNKVVQKPDIIVRNIRTMPAYPVVGQKVTFMASLINCGTQPSKTGATHVVRFYINDRQVACYRSANLSIAEGGMEMICAEGVGGDWVATLGTHNLEARCQLDDEANKTNNSCRAVWTIPGDKVTPIEIAKHIYK